MSGQNQDLIKPSALAPPTAAATPIGWEKSERRFKIFVSYSRSDSSGFAENLVAALEERGLAAKLDTRDLEFGEKWQAQLKDFIRQADTVLFIVSPRSIASRWCRWELAQVAAQSKRLVPVVYGTVPIEDLPPDIGEVHLFPFTPDLDFTARADMLATILQTDRTWLQEHTRLTELTHTWATNQKSSDHLLRGRALRDAETWMARRPSNAPSPSQAHLDFIAASQLAAKSRFRMWTGGLLAVTAGAIGLAGAAVWQRSIALEQRDRALITQSLFLADAADRNIRAGDHATGMLLSLEALPDPSIGKHRPTVSAPQVSAERASRGVLERLLLKGHSKPVMSVVFSANGQQLLTASLDNTARIWDAGNGHEITVLQGHLDEITAAAFSSDGRRVVTASKDGDARLWHLETGKSFVIRHGGPVWSASFSPDDTLILTASHDGTARLSDGQSGKEIHSLAEHQSAVFGAAFSPDGRRAATASLDTTARLWDVQSGTVTRQFGGHRQSVRSVVFSHDGSRLATASNDGTVRLWDAETGHELARLEHENWAMGAQFGKKWSQIVTVWRDNRAILWNPEARQEIELPHPDAVSMIVFAPGSAQVATASLDGSARLWNATSGKEEAIFKGHLGSLRSVAFSPDGRRVATASDDGTARIWDVETKNEDLVLSGHEQPPLAAVFSTDGRLIATASEDATARIWDAGTGRETTILRGHRGIVRSVALSRDRQRVITGSDDNTARIWAAETGSVVAVLQGHISQVYSVAISPDGKTVATGSADTTARLWNAETGREITSLKGHGRAVLGVAFSPDGSRLVTASADGTVRQWQVSTGQEIDQFKGHRDAVTSAVYSPDGRSILSAAADHTAQIWKVGSADAPIVLNGHENAVLSAALSPDGSRIVTGSADRTIRLWDAQSGREIAPARLQPAIVRSVAFSPDGHRLLAAASSNVATITRVFPSTQALVAYLKSNLPRCLTRAQREQFFLDPEPPDWCIAGAADATRADAQDWKPLWPYHAAGWKQWLLGHRKDRSIAMPSDD